MKILRVSNKYSDKKMKTYANTFISKSQIDQIINENMDVYTEDGKLLAKFRKKVLPPKALKQFYDATYLFTSKAITANRGDATGSKQRSLRTNPRVRSAILGYFDRWGPKQKFQFRKAGVKPPLEVRETRFSQEQPDNFKKTFPLVQSIHDQYKKVVPSHFKRQNKRRDKLHSSSPKPHSQRLRQISIFRPPYIKIVVMTKKGSEIWRLLNVGLMKEEKHAYLNMELGSM